MASPFGGWLAAIEKPVPGSFPRVAMRRVAKTFLKGEVR